MRTSAVWLVAIAGCYNPHPSGGTCISTAECPSPLECVRGVCGGTAIDDASPMIDADLTCTCASGTTLQCANGPTTCTLGCVTGTPARCARLVPSNGVDATLVANVSTAISIDNLVTIDTNTGSISGAITRAGVTGVDAGIDYEQSAGLGIFIFDALTITNNGIVMFTGNRAVVFLVARTAKIDGFINGAGGGVLRSKAGPGGGTGANGNNAGGCGPGGKGQSDTASGSSDGGGGGGGGGDDGGAGGDAGSFMGGTAGASCIPADLQPLVGGSGGGQPGLGNSPAQPNGGGGGGAIQISALGNLEISGTINMGGSGGDGGPGFSGDAPGGCGGGGGGGILLEAITIMYGASSVLAANGGGGGGGANSSNPGSPGESGHSSTLPAQGGPGANFPSTAGGPGGVIAIAASNGVDAGLGDNAGGGGGAAGRIFVRTFGNLPVGGMVVSPAAGTAEIVVQ